MHVLLPSAIKVSVLVLGLGLRALELGLRPLTNCQLPIADRSIARFDGCPASVILSAATAATSKFQVQFQVGSRKQKAEVGCRGPGAAVAVLLIS